MTLNAPLVVKRSVAQQEVEAAVRETARRYEATHSWRLTAPLRRAGPLLRRLSRLLRRGEPRSEPAQVARVDPAQDAAVEPQPGVEEADGLHPEAQVP